MIFDIITEFVYFNEKKPESQSSLEHQLIEH